MTHPQPSHPRRLVAFLVLAALCACAWPAGPRAGEQQAAKPSSKPEATFADARVGDWVLYATPFENTTRYEEIVGVDRSGDDTVFRIKYRYDSNGVVTEKERSLTASELAESLMPDDEPGLTVSKGVLDYKGELLDVEILTIDQGETTLTMYYSDLVPLWGLVRAESSMIPMPAMQLLDFGRGEEQ